MGLRDPLIAVRDDEEVSDYLTRALDAAKDAGGSGRLRLEVGPAFSMSQRTDVKVGLSLWVERGGGRAESWQKVTATMVGPAYGELLSELARTLDRHIAAV